MGQKIPFRLITNQRIKASILKSPSKKYLFALVRLKVPAPSSSLASALKTEKAYFRYFFLLFAKNNLYSIQPVKKMAKQRIYRKFEEVVI